MSRKEDFEKLILESYQIVFENSRKIMAANPGGTAVIVCPLNGISSCKTGSSTCWLIFSVSSMLFHLFLLTRDMHTPFCSALERGMQNTYPLTK
jgi:hypothetical protein